MLDLSEIMSVYPVSLVSPVSPVPLAQPPASRAYLTSKDSRISNTTSKVVEVMDKELHGEDKVIKEVNREIKGVELVA